MPAYVDAHGVSIVYDVAEPVGPARAVVQLVHGMGEHAGRWSRLVQALAGAGYVVYADDHRGHGRTGMGQWTDAARLGRLGPGGMRATIAALGQFSDRIRDERPDLPLVLFGHSWGSMLSQLLVNAHPQDYDALVLSGSALRLPGAMSAGGFNRRWRSPTATGREWLASDPAVGEAFLADPLTTSASAARLFGVVDGLRLYGRPGRDLGHDIPTLLMVGRDDPLGGPRSVQRLADAYRRRSGFTDVTTLVYPGARHEIFNEPIQAEVRADLLAWLAPRFPSRT